MYTTRKRSGISKDPDKLGFASCKLKFSGDDDVESFISAVTIFKIVNKIDDATAIRDLYLLLQGKAARWWSGIKTAEFLWTDCSFLLRLRFSNKLQAAAIYSKLHEKQAQNANSNLFIAKKRALIANLPESFSEMYQVNIVVDLLTRDIKDLVKRKDIATFKDLYDEVEKAERTLKNKHRVLDNHVGESKNVKLSRKLVKAKPSTPIQKKKIVKCSHCSKYSHSTESCWFKIKPERSRTLRIEIVNENYNANAFIGSVLSSYKSEDRSHHSEDRGSKQSKDPKYKGHKRRECDLRDILNKTNNN